MSYQLTNRQKLLQEWVAGKYAGRLIPLSGEPYFHHAHTVGKTAARYLHTGYEIVLCHDLLEDRIATTAELRAVLQALIYNSQEIEEMLGAVHELTDVYTVEAFPDMTKKERRKKEHLRLVAISAPAQTVKYADLIYNIGWVMRYEPKKAKRYLKRKLKLLNLMDQGDMELRKLALQTARQARRPSGAAKAQPRYLSSQLFMPA